MRTPIMIPASIADQVAAEPTMPPRKSVLFQDYLDTGALLASPPRKLDFIFGGLLAETIGLVVSPGGVGKSMLALALAASIASGCDPWNILGCAPQCGPVVYVAAEDPEGIIHTRLHSLQQSSPHHFQAPEFSERMRIKSVLGRNWSLAYRTTNGMIQPSPDLEVLREEIAELRPRLVIIDTLNRCLAGLDENDNATMGRIINELEAMIRGTGAACLVIHHTNKGATLNGDGDRQEAVRGASAITANARFQINLIGMTDKLAGEFGLTDEEKKPWVRLVTTKCNYAPPPEERWLKRTGGGVLVGGLSPKKAPPNGAHPAPTKTNGGRRHKAVVNDAEIPW